VILTLALMAQPVPELPQATASDDEIVVTARKLSGRWSGNINTVNDQTTCKTIRSTGDATFDAIGCQAMLKCWPTYLPLVVAQSKAVMANGRIKTKEDFLRANRRGELRKTWQNMGKCTFHLQRDGIRDEIKRRKAAAT
jgi:hypothetical protein